jgi:hypothetical protein
MANLSHYPQWANWSQAQGHGSFKRRAADEVVKLEGGRSREGELQLDDEGVQFLGRYFSSRGGTYANKTPASGLTNIVPPVPANGRPTRAANSRLNLSVPTRILPPRAHGATNLKKKKTQQMDRQASQQHHTLRPQPSQHRHQRHGQSDSPAFNPTQHQVHRRAHAAAIRQHRLRRTVKSSPSGVTIGCSVNSPSALPSKHSSLP